MATHPTGRATAKRLKPTSPPDSAQATAMVQQAIANLCPEKANVDQELATAWPSPTTPAATTAALGTTQCGTHGPVTVYAVRNSVSAAVTVAANIATAGMQFAVADIKLCAIEPA